MSLTEWLASCGQQDVTPLRVTIKGTTYQGAFYRSPHHGNREFIYLLGDLPACYRRSTHTVFNIAGDARDYYVACYMTAERLTAENSEHHPFGQTFILSPWEVPSGEAIDRHAPRSYARVPVTLGEAQ